MKLIPAIILLVFTLSSTAQLPNEHARDSLRNLLPKSANDSNKVLTWILLAKTYEYNNEALGIPAADSAMQLAIKLNWNKGMARAFSQMGRFVGDTGDNLASNPLFLKAIALDSNSGDRYNLAKDLGMLARAYNRESDFPNALNTALRSVDIAENLHDDMLLANLVGNVVITYLNHKNYPKGTEWALRAVALAEKVNSTGDLIDALQHLAYIRTHERNKTDCKALLRQALVLAKARNEPAVEADVLSQLGEAEIDSPSVALPHLYAARNINAATSPGGMQLASTLTLLGKVLEDTAFRTSGHCRRALLDSAIAADLQALKILQASHNRQYVSNVYGFLAQYESEIGHFAAAYDYDLKSGLIYDSLFSQKKKSELAAMQSKHDLDIRDRVIALHRLQATNRKRLLTGLLGATLLLTVIGAMLFRQNRLRKKSNSTLLVLNTKLDEANRLKARFFGILSHDLRKPIANLLAFLQRMKNGPDSLTPEEKAEQQQQIGHSAAELLENMEAMLLWSKEQMDSFTPDWKQIPVAELFTYLQKFFEQERSVKINFVDPGDVVVSGDENYLRVIMQNLTSNALKALNDNVAGFIEWKTVKKGEQILLSITDNGPGLDAEKARALYSDEVTANASSGFGFHLIKDLATAIGYKISVDSLPGRGTTFVLGS